MSIPLKLWNKEEKTEDIMKLFASIITTSQDGVYVCDKDGITLLVNNALLEVTNIKEDTFYKYSLPELIQKRILPKSCAFETLKTKKKHDMIIDYYHGKKAVLTSTPVFDNNGNIFCVVSNVRDITELNNLHQKLKESNKRNIEYQQLLFKNKKTFNDFESKVIFRSNRMEDVISFANKFSKNDSPILLLGESGVGKDVLAKYIHEKSERPGKFVRINCGAIPAHLIESELFGHEKGAFTGADTEKPGLFELSHDGTIFLDEIGDMPFELQVKLLNVLEEKKVRRVGGKKFFSVNMRIIAATNLDLSQMVEKKEFRRDLYYRLNVLPITIPPLRERYDDIPILTFYFLNLLNKKYQQEKQIETEIIDHFLAYNWPGNVRELNNIIERMYHISDTDMIQMHALPQSIREQSYLYIMDSNSVNTDVIAPLDRAINQFEEKYIANAIRKSPTLKDCAKKLDISISTLMRRKRKLNID